MVISFSAVRIADINIYQPSGLPWLWLWGFLECGFGTLLQRNLQDYLQSLTKKNSHHPRQPLLLLLSLRR